MTIGVVQSAFDKFEHLGARASESPLADMVAEYAAGAFRPPSPSVALLDPTTSVLPTIANTANIRGTAGGVTIQPIEVDGERWLQFDAIADTTSATTYFDIAFHVVPPYPFNADSVTFEFLPATPTGSPMVAYIGLTAGYNPGANQNWGMVAPGNQSDIGGLVGHTQGTIHKARFEANKAGFATDVIAQAMNVFKLRVFFSTAAVADQALQFKLRSILLGTRARKGRLAIVVDDGYASWLRSGVPILQIYGLKSTMAIIPNKSPDSGLFASVADLRRYVDAGNFCVAHGPSEEGAANLYAGSLAGGATATLNAARVADMNVSRDFLLKNGLTDDQGAKCYVWPQGVWSAGLGESSLLSAAYAEGYRLARSASIYPTTAALSSSNYERLCNIKALSDKCLWKLVLPIFGHYYNGVIGAAADVAETTNIGKITTVIDNIADGGMDGILMLHSVVPPGGTTGTGVNGLEIETDRLATIAAAAAAKVAAGTLEVVGFPELL